MKARLKVCRHDGVECVVVSATKIRWMGMEKMATVLADPETGAEITIDLTMEEFGGLKTVLMDCLVG